MKKAKFNFKNILAYMVGNLRYMLYYSKYKFLIRTHILEQIDFRIKFMNKVCYENGQCVLCGCETTALQMSNKACEKPCYPKMMTAKQWNYFINHGLLIFCPETLMFWKYEDRYGKPYLEYFNTTIQTKIYEMD